MLLAMASPEAVQNGGRPGLQRAALHIAVEAAASAAGYRRLHGWRAVAVVGSLRHAWRPRTERGEPLGRSQTASEGRGADMSSEPRAAGSPGPDVAATVGRAGRRTLMVWQVLSALSLLAMGGIHLYLVVFGGTGGVLGRLFVLNAVGGLVLAIAMVVLRRRLLLVASVLSLLFLGARCSRSCSR
jgi:hypothetical protein